MLFPTLIGENCWLKTSAQNKISHKGFISGCARNCGPTPAPLPTPSPAPVIPTPPPLPTPIPAPGPEKHVESIGGGLCLEFDKPFLVDSSNSSHLAVVPYVGGTADGQTYFATSKDYVDYNPKAHVHANFGQRLYRSTDQGETWSTKGDARPCCPRAGRHSRVCQTARVLRRGMLALHANQQLPPIPHAAGGCSDTP